MDPTPSMLMLVLVFFKDRVFISLLDSRDTVEALSSSALAVVEMPVGPVSLT